MGPLVRIHECFFRVGTTVVTVSIAYVPSNYFFLYMHSFLPFCFLHVHVYCTSLHVSIARDISIWLWKHYGDCYCSRVLPHHQQHSISILSRLAVALNLSLHEQNLVTVSFRELPATTHITHFQHHAISPILPLLYFSKVAQKHSKRTTPYLSKIRI